MFVMTMQHPQAIKSILDRTHYPQLCDSYYANLSLGFTNSYQKILKKVRERDNLMHHEENCIWAWVSAPAYEVVKRYSIKGYGCVVLEIDETKAVFTDYDAFTEYALGERADHNFFIPYWRVPMALEDNLRVQASFTMSAVRKVIVSKRFKEFLLEKQKAVDK